MGFGSFGTSVRSARTARNPRTGEPIQVPETTVATFAPSKVLKDKVSLTNRPCVFSFLLLLAGASFFVIHVCAASLSLLH